MSGRPSAGGTTLFFLNHLDACANHSRSLPFSLVPAFARWSLIFHSVSFSLSRRARLDCIRSRPFFSNSPTRCFLRSHVLFFLLHPNKTIQVYANAQALGLAPTSPPKAARRTVPSLSFTRTILPVWKSPRWLFWSCPCAS